MSNPAHARHLRHRARQVALTVAVRKAEAETLENHR